jgi:integrase
MQHERFGKPGSITKQNVKVSPLRKSHAPLDSSRLPTRGIESLEAKIAQLYFPTAATKVGVATPARRRGPCLSRRTGQKGTVVQHSKTWDPKAPAYGKFWVDQPGCPYRKRRTVSLGICATKSMARQRLREYLEREGVNSKQAFQQNTAPAVTFRQQAEWWLESLRNRGRRPVKPATISGWRDALNAWLLPNIGNNLLSGVSNGAVRELVEKMSEAGLSAKTIVNYVQVVKLVVASVVDKEGEQIYPRKWNHDFIQLPVVCKEKQHRPTVTEADLGAILPGVKTKYAVLFMLLAGTGLRVGEALALRRTDFGPDCRVLHVRRSIWRGREQEPKTSNAIRAVDIPETLAGVVRSYVAGISGYLFATAQGNPLQQRNVLRVLHGVKRIGLHAFRRFRLTWLRKNGVPKDLERYWMGHAPQEVGDLYSKLKEDVAFRQIWVERTGLGFELVHVGPQNAAAAETATVT